jgi:hypothetical protein
MAAHGEVRCGEWVRVQCAVFHVVQRVQRVQCAVHRVDRGTTPTNTPQALIEAGLETHRQHQLHHNQVSGGDGACNTDGGRGLMLLGKETLEQGEAMQREVAHPQHG